MTRLTVVDNGGGSFTIARNDVFRTPEIRFNGVSRSTVDVVVRTMETIGNDAQVSTWDFGMQKLYEAGAGAGRS